MIVAHRCTARRGATTFTSNFLSHKYRPSPSDLSLLGCSWCSVVLLCDPLVGVSKLLSHQVAHSAAGPGQGAVGTPQPMRRHHGHLCSLCEFLGGLQ